MCENEQQLISLLCTFPQSAQKQHDTELNREQAVSNRRKVLSASGCAPFLKSKPRRPLYRSTACLMALSLDSCIDS